MVFFEDFASRKYLDYGKVFLVLYYKGFSWKKELENEFNISSNIVNKAIMILEKEGFVISKDYWSVDKDLQDIIITLNAGYSNQIKRNPKIFILSKEGKEEGGYVILEKLLDLSEKLSSLAATLELIRKKTEAYSQLKKRFEYQENSLFYRIRKDLKTGIIYETPTKRFKDMKQTIKEELLNIKRDELKRLKENSKHNKLILKTENQVLLLKNEISESSKEKKTNNLLYNNKKVDLNEFEKELNNAKSKDKIISTSKTELGTSLEEIEKYVGKRINYILNNVLNVDNKNREGDLDLCNKIIQNIKEKGWMDVTAVQRTCRDEERFQLFLKLAENQNIIDDGSDFRYLGER